VSVLAVTVFEQLFARLNAQFGHRFSTRTRRLDGAT